MSSVHTPICRSYIRVQSVPERQSRNNRCIHGGKTGNFVSIQKWCFSTSLWTDIDKYCPSGEPTTSYLGLNIRYKTSRIQYEPKKHPPLKETDNGRYRSWTDNKNRIMEIHRYFFGSLILDRVKAVNCQRFLYMDYYLCFLKINRFRILSSAFNTDTF